MRVLNICRTSSLAGSDAPDCRVTAAELKTNNLLQSTLVPDVMIDGVPLISFGVRVSAVSATFTE